MGNRKIDPREQFSKKLAGRAEWFWFGYMILLAFVIILQPDAALPAFYMACLVTAVMIISVCMYTKNSIDEKWFFWLAEIAKATSGWKRQDDSQASVEETTEGDENG